MNPPQGSSRDSNGFSCHGLFCNFVAESFSLHFVGLRQSNNIFVQVFGNKMKNLFRHRFVEVFDPFPCFRLLASLCFFFCFFRNTKQAPTKTHCVVKGVNTKCQLLLSSFARVFLFGFFFSGLICQLETVFLIKKIVQFLSFHCF